MSAQKRLKMLGQTQAIRRCKRIVIFPVIALTLVRNSARCKGRGGIAYFCSIDTDPLDHPGRRAVFIPRQRRVSRTRALITDTQGRDGLTRGPPVLV